MKTLALSRRWLPLLLAVPLCAAAVPMFVRPRAIPAERIIANLEKRIAAFTRNGPLPGSTKAECASLHYKLARVHYLALINQSTLVPAFRGNIPEPAPDHLAAGFADSLRYDEADRRARKALGIDEDAKMDRAAWQKLADARKKWIKTLAAEGWKPEQPSADELHAHAEQAMKHFEQAIALVSDGTGYPRALYELGWASLGEQVLQLERADVLSKRAQSRVLAAWSEPKVRDAYYAAFEHAVKTDLARESRPIEGFEGFVSHEAGLGFLRLTKRSNDLSKGQDEKIAAVRKALGELKEIPQGPITPILIGTGPNSRLAELVDPRATVLFDLDGDGTREPWPWVRATTRILVWDPLESARIDSGRQLFGSVTFFLFHRDGYEALALLDDNLDGELTGLELDGLAVWTDRNGDGRSESDEVEPVIPAGITCIRTEARRGSDGVLRNDSGVVCEDGRVLATVDWVTRRRSGTPRAVPRLSQNHAGAPSHRAPGCPRPRR